LKTYSSELKENILAKMLPPNNLGVPQLARETGIPRDTLYGWRRQALGQGHLPATSGSTVQSLASEEKFAVVMETATLNELELGEYCRRKGLFAEQIAMWRETCREANAPLASKAERAERRAERAEIQRLNREVLRKDKALAEAAALLVLQKKVRAIWEESEDALSPFSDASM
jgi:transposase-like protein